MIHPLISIIITVLNGGATLKQCLDSIAYQSFRNYEVVLIDGGSTDDSVAIMEASSVAGKTVKIIPGIGLYAGLNAGVDLATGEWLYFIGADDQLFDSDTLTKVANYLDANVAKIFTGRVTYVNGFNMAPLLGSPYLMRHLLHHQGTFYHKSIFDQYHYNETLSIASDYELNLRLRLAKFKCAVIDETIALYGEGGISSVQYKKNFAEVQIVNQAVFTGQARKWITAYCLVKQFIWITRNRLGLLNINHRLRSLFRPQAIGVADKITQ